MLWNECRRTHDLLLRTATQEDQKSIAYFKEQLHRLSIPKFSGDFSQWSKFRGLFESLVDVNRSLSNIQKLHYLKTSVTGDAALLIDNLSMSNENYEAAWKLLVDEYEDRSANTFTRPQIC